ncbi:hypothetical protein [Anaeroselena agilis]|uniref:Sporulation membrane protein YtrI C-terminal domain-containing protein n=1 Tax=Anaeroselena agilis TaxID=3063788 RepID=A0ABU3NZ98_9FIRM|nr:hypothetical protein [Selenomonadales bacterium 4137-cl]
MDRLSSRRYALPVCLLAGLFSGFLLGAILVAALLGYRLDESLQRISSLQAAVNEKDARLAKLEESVNKRKYILRRVEVVLSFSGDEMEKTALDKYIKSRYSGLVGKEVGSIDAELAAEVVDNRVVRINNRDYRLTVGKIVVADVLKIWVAVALVPA